MVAKRLIGLQAASVGGGIGMAGMAALAPESRSAQRRLDGGKEDIRLLAVVPEPDLWAMTVAMGPTHLAGVLSGRGHDSDIGALRELGRGLAMPPSVRRPLHPLLARGAAVRSVEVDDHCSKDQAVALVAAAAQAHGLRRRACAGLEQALDEMLLNALYDAPLGADGRPRYAHLLPTERLGVRLPAHERALVRFAGDDRRYVVAVRDRFGALRRGTVLDYIGRCAKAQRERTGPLLARPGGAGVGLFLIASAASELLFRLRRGRLTEVVCAIDMAPGPPCLRALLIEDEEAYDDGGDDHRMDRSSAEDCSGAAGAC